VSSVSRRAALGAITALGLVGLAGRTAASAAGADETSFTVSDGVLTLELLSGQAWDDRRSYLDERVGGRWTNRATQTDAVWDLGGEPDGTWRLTVRRGGSPGYDEHLLTPVGSGSPQVPGGLATAYSGAYVGSGGSRRATEFGAWRGRPTTLAVDYLEHGSASSLLGSLRDPGYWIDYPGKKLVLGVPIIDDARAMTFAAGAAGAYDGSFAALGVGLVAGGHRDAILRIAWEANGSFSPYHGSDAAAFVAYFRRVVAALRRAPGQRFQIDLCMSNSSGAWGDRYPGDDVVDILSTDVYDFDYSAGAEDHSPAQRFRQLQTAPSGLDYLTALAARTTGPAGVPTGDSKPIAVAEWAVTAPGDFGGHGGGDSPEWVRAFHDWLAAQPQVVYESYFDDAGGGQLDGGRNPRAAAAYRSLFGGS